MAEAVYAWPCESISRGRADSRHSRPYQGIWNQGFPTPLGELFVSTNPIKASDIRFLATHIQNIKAHQRKQSDQRLVHTPFVPSRYWSSCAPLLWNQGFLTSLGGLSMSKNPVKALNIRFSSSQFRKQHPRHEKAVSRTSLAEAIYA
ncbi:unnamed protein product [Schistosoma mattheei]|uniref:Uncharacterized protein n=1 Tax=Schistosoma mattheei TaxID=31246 RepID=A0A3P8EV35_9TREM|nr:unnamed protein product [Schistosoma mattheei]